MSDLIERLIHAVRESERKLANNANQLHVDKLAADLRLELGRIAELEAEVARLRMDESRLSLEWNKHLYDILGRPNFTCSNIAKLLRRGGATIPRKSEDEQAHTIHYLLCQYAKHGDKWIEKANESLAAIRAAKEQS